MKMIIIVSDNRIINNDIIGFAETQIKSSDSTCKILETLNFFNVDFNNNENKFSSLAYRCRNDAALLNKFDENGISSLGLKKRDFGETVFTLMLVYRKQSTHMQEVFQMLQYLRATNSIDIITGDFNHLKMS